jgi:hypothetical protein
VRRLTAALAVGLCVAGCGGGKPKPEHATLTSVTVHASSVDFVFDSQPQSVRSGYVSVGTVAECGSGRLVTPRGTAIAVVHFLPAQSQGVPKRIIMPSGPVLDVAKVCDFEADVGWAIGVERRLPLHVSRDGSTVTVTFGRP